MPDAIFSLQEHARPRIGCTPRAHLVGIAGGGMRSLAEVLSASGWRVSGSDPRCDAALAARYGVRQTHAAELIDDELDLVVHSDAVPLDNAELARAAQLQLPIYSYPRMLGRLMESRLGIAIAGTHGKSTTTSMAAEILVAAGIDPTVVHGAAPVGKLSGGRLGRGPWMLAEACEYRENFCHLRPQLAVILNLEADHFDCFDSLTEVEGAFTRFAGGLPEEGLLLSSADCAATRRVAARVGGGETFGRHASATWRASALHARRGCYGFEVRCRGRLLCDVQLRVPGRHNVHNALAAAAVASHCGATAQAIRTGLSRYAGLERRLQCVGQNGSITVLDDYAHHPTEVAAALASAREMHPTARLWCVFQPHQVSRTTRLLDDFASSLQNSDKLLVADIFHAREAVTDTGTEAAERLRRQAAALGARVVPLGARHEIRDHLREELRGGDVVITLGAGDIGTVAHELAQGIRQFRQAG